MRFERSFLSARHLWSSPFVRWQGRLADVSSLDLAVAVTGDALRRLDFDPGRARQIVLGMTIPQPRSFYAAPWIAARLGMAGIGGPHIAQACATSVACVVAAAQSVEGGDEDPHLVVTTDRTSNGPLLVYPRTKGMAGAPSTEHWVLDSFASDPWTGESMLCTAEAVARDGAMSREAVDALTLLRFAQYQAALADDRAFQRRWMQPVVIAQGKGRLVVEADEGVHPYTAEGLASLEPAHKGGVTTFGSQTHPADGCAGALVAGSAAARELAAGDGTVRLLSAASARAEKARMPKAAALAAQRALVDAGIRADQLACVTTHNPFAVNDIWLGQQTGLALELMNPYGCSLIFGHPQAPTGLRSIVELVHALRERGGGVGLFTGCAAGDTGAALVLRVD
ncbi:MAG TPA: thiolase family protein [Caldimonas sp.]|nr:thiolase family protein [Caldimonas sp.]